MKKLQCSYCGRKGYEAPYLLGIPNLKGLRKLDKNMIFYVFHGGKIIHLCVRCQIECDEEEAKKSELNSQRVEKAAREIFGKPFAQIQDNEEQRLRVVTSVKYLKNPFYARLDRKLKKTGTN